MKNLNVIIESPTDGEALNDAFNYTCSRKVSSNIQTPLFYVIGDFPSIVANILKAEITRKQNKND